MDKEKALAGRLFRIAALGFYLAALGFFIAAIVGQNLTYTPIGAAFMCLGSLFLVLSRRKKNKDDSEKQ